MKSSLKTLIFALLVQTSPAFSATLYKVSEGPGAGWSSTIGYVTGGSTQAVAGVQSPPYNFLRYAPPNSSIRYSFPTSAATSVTLHFIEPRAAQTVGQRLMSVSVNGATVLSNFDLFVSAGSLTPKTVTFQVQPYTGPLTISISSSVGNVVVSGIQIDGNLPPPPPLPGLSLFCNMGTVPYSVLTSSETMQDVVIVPGVSENFRFDHVFIRETVSFAGLGLTSVRFEPGLTPNIELQRTPGNYWNDRTGFPVGIGSYDIKLRFSRMGPMNALTAGVVYWEVCGYNVPALP